MNNISDRIRESAALKRSMAEDESLLAQVEAAVVLIAGALQEGRRVLFCGNGGSAADAQHLATELLIRLRSSVERPSWPAIALTLDPTALTAAGNDYGFEEVFARPLAGLGRAGDVLFGITTSGKSPNVLRALETARGMGIVTVGLLGGDGGPALALCEHALVIPSQVTARVQEAHISLGHAVMELLEDRLVRR